MIELKRISPIFHAKFGIAMTIMVFTSACAHEIFVRPANNDSVQQELNQTTPEPQMWGQASPISETKTAAASVKKHGKRVASHKHKAKKSLTVAHHKAKAHKTKHVVTQVASVKEVTPVQTPPAPPAPEIAPPSIPAPLASAGVQTEITDDGNHFGSFLLYGLGALAILGLIYVAPRARRKSGPKRKLVFNG